MKEQVRKTPFKQIIREELNIVGIELHGHYYNDLTRNKKTQRRIKVGVSRFPSVLETDMVTDSLARAFKCKVDAKVGWYWNSPTVVFYLRR